ncbi:MAG: hypothetical protein RL033_906 [Pseudomonadota bacterium]|jgi:hypothetical protein
MSMYRILYRGALTAATTKTFLVLATPSTKRAIIKQWGVSLNGVDASQTPVLVELMRFTTAGTGGTTIAAPVKEDPGSEASLLTASFRTPTAEPTAGDILEQHEITPAGGLLVMQYALGDEPVMGVSQWLGIRYTTVTGVAPTMSAHIKFAE